MKAPEKLYLRKRNKLPLEVVRDEWYEKDPQYMYGSIEYTRTDVFIEKACEFVKSNIDHYIGHYLNDDDTYLDDSFIEDFKKYMKGK